MIHGVILTDNTYNNLDISCNRGSGAHKIATHLRKHGYNIEVVDYCLTWTQEEYEQLFAKLISSQTLFLGIGSNLFLDRPAFDNVIRWFKSAYPQVPIVLGGNQVLTRTIPMIDYYVEGYAENAILKLLDYIRGKIPSTEVKWSQVDNKLIDATSDYGPVDTTDLSVQYIETDFLNPSQTLGLETARGCIFKCKFCTYPLLGKKKLDYIRDPQTIVDELKRNYDQWGTTNYLINEDTFNDSVEKIEMLEQAVTRLPFKIRFTAYARLDLILAKPHTAELLHNMGMRGVHFGVETFDANAGKLIGKGVTGQRLRDGIMWWKQQMPDVTTTCSMIVGLPLDASDYRAVNNWFSTSGVDYWYWQPLYITKEGQTIHTSEFSREYYKYGLELMTKDQINSELNRLWKLEYMYKQRKHPITYRPFIDENFRGKVGYWRNPANEENYFTALEMSCELNQTAKDRKVSPWTMFDYVSLGYDLSEVQSWGHGISRYPAEPTTDTMRSKAEQIIQDYKQKKLAFGYDKLYNQPTYIKTIIPISYA